MNPVPVLTYHSVADEPSAGIARFSVGRRQFRDHLRLMDDLGVTTLPAAELARLLRERRPLPARCCVITFDDGFRDNLAAFEELAAAGRQASLFVSTGQLDGVDPQVVALGPMLAPSDLAELVQLGAELGAHGHTHRALDIDPPARVAEDIERSKHLLETWTGEAPSLFAYPFGYHRRRTRHQVGAAGFAAAFGVGNCSATAADDQFGISRFLVERTTALTTLTMWLEGRGPRSIGRERPTTSGYRAIRWARRLAGVR
jgi:peptidoglycan/xylan/chitin deacetylase (PgdA/CDA1 family)